MIAPRRPTYFFALALALAPATSRAQSAPGAAAPATVAASAPTPATAEAGAPPPAVTVKDDEGEPRLSLPTEADRDAWTRAGFRLSLGVTYGRMYGLEGAPSGRLLGAIVRFGIRLDADWSILASFQYDVASSTNALYGLRFGGTIDPTWHATRHLSLALGLGFGGIAGGRHGMDIPPIPSSLGASYTFPSPSPSLPTCSGVGAAGLARAEWSWVIGPRSATGLGLEVLGQWTGCVDNTGLVEPDTGQAIVRRQWWPHAGLTGTWSVTWR
jgi:hypothetical protein